MPIIRYLLMERSRLPNRPSSPCTKAAMRSDMMTISSPKKKNPTPILMGKPNSIMGICGEVRAISPSETSTRNRATITGAAICRASTNICEARYMICRSTMGPIKSCPGGTRSNEATKPLIIYRWPSSPRKTSSDTIHKKKAVAPVWLPVSGSAMLIMVKPI